MMPNSNNIARNDNCCECTSCMPYKDGLFIAAHVTATVGFILSWSSFLGGTWLALVGWIILLCSCCCRTNRCGLITSGVFLALSVAACFIQACLFFGNTCKNSATLYYTTDDYYGFSTYHSYQTRSAATCNLFGVFSMLASVTLLAATVLIFIFTCTGRLEKQLDIAASRLDNQPATTTATVIEIKPQNTTTNNNNSSNKQNDVERGDSGVGKKEEEEIEITESTN